MNIEGDYLVIEIDNDESIDNRYKRHDFKQWRKTSLKSLALMLDSNEVVHVRIHITNRHNINVRIKFGAVSCFTKTYKTNDEQINHNALTFLNNKGNIATFALSQFVFQNGRYFAKVRITPMEMETMVAECCACYEENKQTSVAGYFTCNHKILCNDCYNKLKSICCPYCRSHMC
jgi:hypothetical protein